MSSHSQPLQKVLNALAGVYALDGTDDYPVKVMTACRGIIPADYHSWMEVDIPRRALMEVAQLEPANTKPDEVQHAMRELPHEHPCFTAALRLPAMQTVMSLMDFTTFRQWQNKEFYRLVHKPNGIKDQLIGGYKGQHGVFGFMLGRDKAFTQDERMLMEFLQPHLVQSWVNSQMYASAQKRSSTLPDRIVPLSRDGLVADWPTSVLDALRFHSRAPVLTYRVPVPDDFERWLNASLQLLKNATDVPRTLQPYVAERDESTLVARLILGSHDQRPCVVFEVTQKRRDIAKLRSRYNLTERECEVAIWVAEGKRNDEIGIILGCKANTVRKHVERLFEKLGAETRSAVGARVHEALGQG